MPYQIDPNRYGFSDIDDLARVAGTLQGEAGNQDLRGRAMVVDLAANRGSNPLFNAYNRYTDAAGNTYSGVAAQLANPSQFSTWLPKETGAYNNATEMYNIINQIGADPSYYDRLSPDMQQQVDLNLSAVNGVLGTADLRGLSGGATYYSTGNPAAYGPGRYDEHVGLGLGVAKANNPLIGGEYWYGGNPANTQGIYNSINNFDFGTAAGNLALNYDPGRQRVVQGAPLPPERPSDADLGLGPSPGPLDAFSDAITGGLESAGNAIGGAFTGAGNALNQGLGNLFGGGSAQAAAFNPDVGPYTFGSGFNPFGGNALSGGGYNPGNLYGMPLPPSFYAPGGGIQTPDPIANPGFDAAQAQGVDTSNLFGAAYPQAAPSYGAPDLDGMFGGGAGIFNGGGGYSPGGFYGGRGAFNIGGFGAVPQFGGMPSVDASPLGPDQTAGTLGPDQSADPFGAGVAGLPLGLGGQAVQPYGFNGFGGRSIFNGAQALPYGFGGALAPTLGFNGTDAATLGPDQSVTATDQAPAPDPFGFSGLNLGSGAGQTFGGLYGVPAAPAFNPFGGSQYGLFGTGFNPSAGIGAQTFSGLYGLPGLPPSMDVNTLGADPTATLGPDASAATYGFNGTQVQPVGFNGASAMPFGFGGFNARTLGFGGSNAMPLGFGGQQAFPGFFGADAQTLGSDQSATAMAPAAPAPGPFGFGGLNFGAGLGAQPQSFGGLFGTGNAPAAPAYNPFGGGIGGFGGFGGGFNVGGGLGAAPQSFGSLFGAPAAAPAAPAPSPFGFGGDVSGFDPNAFAPAAPPDAGDGSGFGSTPPDLGFGFDPQASENAFLRGQMANNAAMQQAGQAPQASNPNLYPSLFAAIAPTPTNGTSYIASQPSYAPAPGFSAPVSYAAPQVSLMMAAPQISLPTMNFSGGGFGGLGGFL